MSRLPISQLSFADLQLQSQGIHLDPTLQRVADFLEENTALVELVRKDLERGLKKPMPDATASPLPRPCARWF